MKRSAALLAVPVLAGSMTLSACGGGNSGQTATTSSPAATAAAGNTAATSAAGASSAATDASSCPTDNTKMFPKARFLADIGVAGGTFHRWIYKPYKAGTFKQGAQGRTIALVKAASVAALDLKLISNAYDNVGADPLLCKSLKAPLGKLKDTLQTMKGQITKGDLSSIATTETVLGGLEGDAKKDGLTINESTDEKSIPAN